MISLVMCTYNGENYILQQLESIYKQTIKPDEVIICDDGSKDNTLKIIKGFITKKGIQNWHLIINKKTKGFCLNFIDAMNMAKGDFIFLADQDDIWKANKIELMSHILECNPNILSLTCRYQCIDEENRFIEKTAHKHHETANTQALNFETFMNIIAYPGMTMAIRRECLDMLAFVKGMPLVAHDFAINVICSSLGRMYLYDKSLVLYRLHSSNTIGLRVKQSHSFDALRINLLQEQVWHFKQAKEILNHLPIGLNQQIKWLSKKEDVYNKRILFLKKRQLLGILELGCQLFYYPSLKTYLGDIFTCLKLKFSKIE